MNGKVPITLLCSAVLAFACGPRSRNDAASASNEPRRVVASADAGPLTPSLDVTVAHDVRFAFQVMNASKKKLEVNFRDGKTHEVVVLDSLGREVWRWSDGRMFTQAMQNRVLRTSDLLQYEEKWSDPAPGRYVVVATLASENYPVERRAGFTVR